jgi:ribosomal protein S18 acetylase RimI-like enzyme
VLRTQRGLRVLGADDLPALAELVARSPVVNVFADFRARSTRLDPRRLGGEVWGYHDDGELVSACHAAANLVPVEATPPALDAFAERALAQGRRCATIVGPMDDVTGLWERLQEYWPPPRDVRLNQPHLEISGPPAVAPDPRVARSTQRDMPALYPACVAMHTEELGVSPEEGGGGDLYRARVSQLVERGWSFARIEDGRVLFKAEIASVTPYACQVQGVYVDPAHRGQGLAAQGMAAVVDIALREIAPVVSLYVNEHNTPARRAYERVGFKQTAEFGTILF